MKAAALLLALLGLTGCSHYFHATGTLASDGGEIGTFRSTPEGCSRDPADGLPASMSSTVLTFLWEDPAVRDIRLRDNHRQAAPNAPLRLEISRQGGAYVLTLNAVKSVGTRLDGNTCTTLRVDTQEGPPSVAEGRPTLGGTVQLECGVAGSHIMADIRFERCEY